MKYILIDDDKLIHLGWISKAKKLHLNLATYFSIEDFTKDSLNLENDTHIYIDSSLKDGVKGEFEAKKLFEMGFRNLYLTTGFTDMKIEDYPWLKGIVSKKPPF